MPVGVILRAFLFCLKNPIKIQEKSRQIQFWLGLIFFTINIEKQGGIFDE